MNTTPSVLGIHHVTAMAGDAQTNLDFYTRVLGLRLVKRTVNFDDPGTYHFYFGDKTGTPGTLTFFPWGARSLRGRIGTGQVSVTSFSIPAASMSFWKDRLSKLDVSADGPAERFDESVLSLHDRDGGIAGLSGGLIGPPGTAREYPVPWTARRCSSAAATSTRTFPRNACSRPPKCWGEWTPR